MRERCATFLVFFLIIGLAQMALLLRTLSGWYSRVVLMFLPVAFITSVIWFLRKCSTFPRHRRREQLLAEQDQDHIARISGIDKAFENSHRTALKEICDLFNSNKNGSKSNECLGEALNRILVDSAERALEEVQLVFANPTCAACCQDVRSMAGSLAATSKGEVRQTIDCGTRVSLEKILAALHRRLHIPSEVAEMDKKCEKDGSALGSTAMDQFRLDVQESLVRGVERIKRKLGLLVKRYEIANVLRKRWVPWLVYSLSMGILVAFSMETTASVLHTENGRQELILLVASITLNYAIITHLEADCYGVRAPGGGMVSAAGILDDFLDSTQLMLLLVDQEKKPEIGLPIQLLILVFSCANYVTPTVLLRGKIPHRVQNVAKKYLDRGLEINEFYDIVDKICVDIPRMLIRFVLMNQVELVPRQNASTPLEVRKNVADEDVLELFAYKTMFVLLVTFMPLLVRVYNTYHRKCIQPHLETKGMRGLIARRTEEISPGKKGT